MSLSMGISPILQVAGVAFSCGLAFMLPVAISPNSIVYRSNTVCPKEMMKAGIVLNLLFGARLSLIFLHHKPLLVLGTDLWHIFKF